MRWRELATAWSGFSVLVAAGVLALAGPQALSGHAAWPTYYSAKCSVSLAGDELRVVVTVEIPLPELVLEFNAHFADTDLIAEIEKGRIDELEEEFRQAQFERLGDGLSLQVDGVEVAGAWRPVATPVNGRGAEGFFVYLLEMAPESPLRLGVRARLVVNNRLYLESQIMLANVVETGEGWRVVESSTPQPAPGADLTPGTEAELAMWSDDPSYREFRLMVERLAEDL